MLLPAHRGSRPLILTPWQRVMNAICWGIAAVLAQPVLAWDHLRAMTWRDWIALPGHLLHFALHAVFALWGLALLATAAACLLAIPVGLAWMLGTLAWRWLGW